MLGTSCRAWLPSLPLFGGFNGTEPPKSLCSRCLRTHLPPWKGWSSRRTLLAGGPFLAHGALDDHAVEALLEGVAVRLLLGQDGGELAGALGVADGLEGLDPGDAPVDR